MGFDLEADATERIRARGVLVPLRRQSRTKVEAPTKSQRITIAIAPEIAIAGVALKMKRPALHAM
ncbi:MAG: Uncharacterised protein [Methanobacteriota archaeon]|nr:MAG: Uncharacterised protein [Euryarchaeota archaeon]